MNYSTKNTYVKLLCAEAEYAYWKNRYNKMGDCYLQLIIAKGECENAGADYLYSHRVDKE